MAVQDAELETLLRSDLASAFFFEAADALLIVDPPSERLLDVNPMAEKLSGMSREDLLQFSLRDLLHHEINDEAWHECLHQPNTFHGQDGFVLRTEQSVLGLPVSVSISRLTLQGSEALALVTLRDRTDQVEANRRSQRAEAELRRVLASVTDCLWKCRIDVHGQWRYRYLSPAVERITGRPVGYFFDDPRVWRELIELEDLPRWERFIAQVSAGNSAEIEYRLRRSDGTICWVRESVVVTGAEETSGILAHGVLTDVTERKQVEQAALERRLLEAQKLESLGVLAGGIAHDFNNLLAIILGNTGLAKMSCPHDSSMQDYLDQIEATSLRAADLCKQMLAYAGKGRMVMAPVQLNTVLREAAKLPHVPFSRKTVLRLELDEDLPAALADATQMRQLAANLFANALESFGDAEGQICVRTSHVRVDQAYRKQAFAAALSDNDYVLVEVSDDGPGMAPEVRTRIFEPFFTTKFTGRGLGLAAVLGIVRGHQGALHVESRPGTGTTFTILLPCSEQRRSPDRLAAVPAPACKGKGTVLLVDDEEAVRGVTTRMLTTLGYDVVPAVDGCQAIELFQLHGADICLVLLDLTMPRMNGEEAYRQLRAMRPELPVILMSGCAEPDAMCRFTGKAPSGFLQKPFHSRDLLAILRSLVTS